MEERIINEKAKKQLQGIYGLGFLIFIIYSINESFSNFFLITFSKVLGLSDYNLKLLLNNTRGLLWGALPFMAIMAYRWMYDFKKYIKSPNENLRKILRKKIENIYFSFFYFYIISFLLFEFLSWLRFDQKGVSFWITLFPAILFSFLTQLGFILPYVDSMLYRIDELMSELYEKKELLRPRIGKSVPFFYKLVFLLLSCAIFPLLMLFLAIKTDAPFVQYKGQIGLAILFFVLFFTVGIRSIFYGLHKPLEVLIEKMKRVSEGDYDASTRVYFNDEIGKIKAGFNFMLEGLKEREQLYSTFGKYLSIEIARELVKNGKVNLGGEEIKAAVMFCDIRNFTPISEKMPAKELVSFLNDYFYYITPPVIENKGIISKFMGDGIMCVFASNLGCENYADSAVNCAFSMREALKKFNSLKKYPFEISFGIGLHAGTLVAGNIGTPSRLEYTFIGDTVNVASRIEGKTKDFSCDILASAELKSAIKDNLICDRFVPMGETALKGKSMSIKLFKVI
jgi:adenylate cyclase